MTLENSRFFQIVERLKKEGKLSDYVNLASILGTNKAGISDLKQGRKKLSIEIIRRMKYSYPLININWLITGEGEMFEVHIKKMPETGNESPMSQPLELINKLLEQAKEIGKLENEIKNLREKLKMGKDGAGSLKDKQEEDVQDAGFAAVGS